MLSEPLKTSIFVLLAVISSALAGWSYYANRPPQSKEFELVGKTFFENFEDAKSAAFLEISALNEDGELQSFVLQKVKGIWRIPTHSDYPAEAAERLAKVATALIGLKREAIVGRVAAEHSRFGVRDPKSTDATEASQAGKRLILRDESGKTLADLIIGKQVEQGDKSVTDLNLNRPSRNEVYVRRADENQVFKTNLDLSLSTKFSDWIDTRLIALEDPQVVALSIDNYQLINNPRDPLGNSRIKQKGDQILLTQADGNRWTIAGIDETKERVNTRQVDQLIDIITNLQIVGVREKFRYQGKSLIGPDMKLIEDPELMQDREQFGKLLQTVALDLSRRGFYLQAPEQGDDLNSLQMVSEFGQLAFTTSDGFVFNLDLGKTIEGDPKAIEIGTADAELGADTADGAESKNASEATAESEKNAKEPTRKNRFVLIRVGLDESRVGGGPPVKPNPPEEPQKPEGYTPPPESKAKTEEKSEDAEKQQQQQADDAAPPPVENVPPRDPAFEKYDQDLAKYEAAKIEYEISLSRYEKDLEKYQKDLEAARKKLGEMNERYGAWYYVVSAANLESLRTDRASLIEPVPPSKPDEPDSNPADGDTPLQSSGSEMADKASAENTAKNSAAESDQSETQADGGSTRDKDQTDDDDDGDSADGRTAP